MRERGYSTKFIYGGYGYFDNMNYFFRHNGFEVVDRTDFAKAEITFENAWGVCDEDLFGKSLSEFNRSYQERKPFFALVLTTSNHRPYTYPEGKIDIPSHTGRDGGVKYTDYAIGELLKRSQKEPWFKDTIFLITADHCGDSAGDRDLPVNRYEIPLFIYSPGHFTFQRIDKLSSQIDIAPTVLGLLNESYESKFFGKDIFRIAPDQERAFIGTYQKLGYVKRDNVVILDVKKGSAMYRNDRENGKAATLPVDPRLLEEAITYYQGAYELEQRSLNRWEPMGKENGEKGNHLSEFLSEFPVSKPSSPGKGRVAGISGKTFQPVTVRP
jgi:phosphoglycerol transferase MdoB-like AlkP superfamily enzyme